jgi:predicted amidohydrolase
MFMPPAAAHPWFVDLFAVQPYMTLADYQDPERFREHMARLGRPIADRSHEHALVVFPEDLATFLALAAAPAGLDQASTLNQAFAVLGRRALPRLLWSRIRHRAGSLEAAFFVAAAPAVYRLWHQTFSHLARTWGATVVAGSALMPQNRLGYGSDRYVPQDARVLNLSLTFGPDGRVVDHAAKVNLVPTQEDTLHLTPSRDARSVYRVGPVTVGTASCYDAFATPHTAHEPDFQCQVPILADLGAVVIAQPSANPWRWHEAWPLARPGDPPRLRREQWREEGLWAAMQRSPSIAAGVNPQLLAELWDVHFDGQSMILARLGSGGDAPVEVVASAPRGDAHPDSETLVHWTLTMPEDAVNR